jgi:ferric-dicitrate binding protein FerR (iron transport regulator)
MNRYNGVKLVVESPAAAALVINGLFQAGDSTHFANAVARTYGLTVIERGDRIVLAGQPND